MNQETKSLFIFGFGYSAQHFANHLLANGYQVFATKRSLMAVSNPSPGLTLIPFDDRQSVMHFIARTRSVLISIPPDIKGRDGFLKQYFVVFDDEAMHFDWIAYLSSTGVYGDAKGAWVSETSSLNPIGETATRRLQVEMEYQKLYEERRLPVHIFRLAGIYGPKRNKIQRLKAENYVSIHKKGQFFSRIHVDDIAKALWASLKRPTPGEIFNVCDDEPASSKRVDEYLCTLLGRGKPPIVDYKDATLSKRAKEFYRCSRRVDNQKIKQILNIKWNYPSFREGFQAIFDSKAW